MNPTTESIAKLFSEKNVTIKMIHHEACHTSEESAQARAKGGGGLVVGAKALLLKLNRPQGQAEYSVFVLAGPSKLNSKAIDTKFRFATREEMATRTGGLEPGAMPPFAKPIFPALDNLYVDSALAETDQLVGFNAGDHRVSIVVHIRDLILAASPTKVFSFSVGSPEPLCDELVEGRNYSKPPNQ